VAAETPAQPSAGGEPPGRPARPAGFPWREIALAASVVLLGTPVAVLAFAFPFAAFVAALDRRPRRLAAAALAAALPTAFALQVPPGRFFVVAAVLAVGATLLSLRAFPRAGYPEVAASAFAGLLVTAGLWLVLDPAFFGQFQAVVESSTRRLFQEWGTWLARSGGLDAAGREALEEVFAASARWYARVWPTGAFLVLWLGVGVALELAARWGRGDSPARARVAVGQPLSAFRLPDLWVWFFLTGMAAFLVLPRETAAGEAALNVALIVAGLYACQGMALFVYYLERRGIGPVRRAVGLSAALLLLPIPLLVTALCLGLADVWLDLRQRPGGDASAGPDS
jgi:hypothetical protein